MEFHLVRPAGNVAARIEPGLEPLVEALRVATRLEREALLRFGARGRRWMQRDVGWERVAVQMGAVYRWLREGGEAPESVRVD